MTPNFLQTLLGRPDGTRKAALEKMDKEAVKQEAALDRLNRIIADREKTLGDWLDERLPKKKGT